MEEQRFKEPALALNRIYTKTGDGGDTALVGGQRVPKDSARLDCYGTVDELNAFTGAAAVTARTAGPVELALILERIQHELFNLGSILATEPADVGPKQPRITEAEVRQLEAEMDRMNESLPALRSFVLPGGSRLNAELHICRTVCRRAERAVVALRRSEAVDSINIHYLNRLSDAFFVYSRWANLQQNAGEVLWQPNQASSARIK